MAAPALYRPGFLADADAFATLWSGLPWERRPDAPRRECWMTDLGQPYGYGRGAGFRTYHPQAWHPLIKAVQQRLAAEYGVQFEGCFTNGYEGPRDHLGWHADDSPEIDAGRPIAVVSLGSSRRIQFKPIDGDAIEEVLLEPGSLLLMAAGMQQTHYHRIPKHGAACGARISLTFRGLVPPHLR